MGIPSVKNSRHAATKGDLGGLFDYFVVAPFEACQVFEALAQHDGKAINQMDVSIDDARNEIFPCGVNNLYVVRQSLDMPCAD
ncbi:hypothetical protein D3C84_1143810 [compost metagenome]